MVVKFIADFWFGKRQKIPAIVEIIGKKSKNVSLFGSSFWACTKKGLLAKTFLVLDVFVLPEAVLR